jgi:hypothetical protein
MNEGFESALFHTACLVFRSPTKMHLFLKLKSSAMSSSLQVCPGDLYAVESRVSLPIGMQTPVVSTQIRGGRSTWLWRMPFLTATAVPSFLTGWQ